MGAVPQIVLFVNLATASVEIGLLYLLLRRGLGRALASAAVRLVWGAALLLLSTIAALAPGRWELFFAPVMAHYLLLAIFNVLWMGWDARLRVHPLSGMAFRWLGTATLINASLPFLYQMIPPAYLQLACSGSIVISCCRLLSAVWDWQPAPMAQLVWYRDGRCRLDPPLREPDYLIDHPELLLRIVEAAAGAEYREPLLVLLRLRLARRRFRSVSSVSAQELTKP